MSGQGGNTSLQEEEASDVELQGMDMGNDDEIEADDEEDVADTLVTTHTPQDDDNEHKDHEEMEQAHKERAELMAAEKGKAQEAPASVEGKLQYLLAQSDVFAHFLAGTVAVDKKKGKKGSRGNQSRMSEAEEDAVLLKTAQSKRRGVVRLDKQPPNLAPICKMHGYQLEGLNWLIKLHDHGINGILADEMGLGKTLQTISLLAYLRSSRGVKGPHIVIVPKSVVGNWMREIRKWCPEIAAVRMGGTKDERQRFANTAMEVRDGKRICKFDVLVTSYEGMVKEKGRLSKVNWRYVIIDEAHRIKNEVSSLSLAVRKLPVDFRLLITGTPLQNNLRELWALLNFLMPDIFGNANQFDEWFSLRDESGKENVIKRLHTVLRPFMLRRVKKDVATGLPPKKEIKLYIGLTDLQQKWYVSCLQKDAHELNKLGGPERSQLFNVLMHLRKVCNHPYLFDGAEPGPPYTDGPHLWENSGKMKLLHKLLPKLKAQGSRVLIFCQMTRLLDILDDYCRLVGYDYCRIDGNTDGERRDSQMDEFNAERSSKFIFLLSTRAGGLGINLATADIVILYDSDWNPQVDLQAMDRAHRIGQTKPVKVFRFVTEGTVEEKIIERADRKLFLDAAVIQQGRLAEQHASLEKGELMKMVRFGADQILSGKGGTYTDEDIDALIAKGEERTDQMQAELRDAKHDLANFSLLAEDDEGRDTFSFDGKNYREDRRAGTFITLPQRQRKRNYDLQASEARSKPTTDGSNKKKKKGPSMHDFQLFDIERLNYLHNKDKACLARREQLISAMKSLGDQLPTMTREQQQNAVKQIDDMKSQMQATRLSVQEEAEKKKLLEEGFPDWSKKDFRCFVNSLEKYGRYDFSSVWQDMASETEKDMNDVQRYFIAFWSHYERIADSAKIIERIERGEKKILRLRQIRDAIHEKVERHLEEIYGPKFADYPANSLPTVEEMLQYSWSAMKINYAGSSVKGKGYREEEDAFLVCMMYRHGFGAAERIRMEIRRAWQFRFNWFFKSRNAFDIQRRCETLVKIVEKDNEEAKKKETEEATKQVLQSNTEPTAAAETTTASENSEQFNV